jgi:hypothetical protein
MPTKIAVFSSPEPAPAAARDAAPAAHADPAAVLVRARELIAARSPGIAVPMLDRALAAGAITPAERAALLRELVGADDWRSAPLSLAAQRLRSQIRAAIVRATPALARPVLDEAVRSARLTQRQRMRITHRLRDGVRRPVCSPL